MEAVAELGWMSWQDRKQARLEKGNHRPQANLAGRYPLPHADRDARECIPLEWAKEGEDAHVAHRVQYQAPHGDPDAECLRALPE